MQLSGTIAEQLKKELSYAFGRVLDIEVIDLNENPEFNDEEHFAAAFAAVSVRKEGHPIEAVVCLLKRYPDQSISECLMEEVHESEGPRACFCPGRILDRLTPTRDVVSLSWRKRCRTLGDWEEERWVEQMLEDFAY
jgi:hypothetical protein